jgi:hypothetical protein
VSEINERARLSQLMARRLKKLAGLTPGKTSQKDRAISIQAIPRSSGFNGDSLLRSLERHRSVHDANVLGDLIALMRKRGAARGLAADSLLTKTDGIRGLANASDGALKGFPGEPVTSGRSAESRRVKLNNPSLRRYASAISKVAPQWREVRTVADSVSSQSEKRGKEEFTGESSDKRLKARRLNSHRGTSTGIAERSHGSALIAAESYSSLQNADRPSSDYAARVSLGQKLALRSKTVTAAARLMSAKSKNGRDLTGRHLRAEHPGVASEGREAKHRRGVTLKTSALALGSLRAAQRAPRIHERSRPALTVNFNPMVVLEAEPDQAAKKNIVEALSRHSHELVQLIEHEIAKQRRVEFAS